MNRLLIAVAMVTAFINPWAATGADPRSLEHNFLGLWEGVDVNDGSKRTISITDHENDGVFEVASRDTFWTLCNGDRGLEIASGVVDDEGILVTEGVVNCFDDPTQLPIQQTYEYSRRSDTLVATPLGTGLIPITLHRVSD
ncbi:MAG: hypothetical protein P8Y44_06700 [Acidobacteriota bacterium]